MQVIFFFWRGANQSGQEDFGRGSRLAYTNLNLSPLLFPKLITTNKIHFRRIGFHRTGKDKNKNKNENENENKVSGTPTSFLITFWSWDFDLHGPYVYADWSIVERYTWFADLIYWTKFQLMKSRAIKTKYFKWTPDLFHAEHLKNGL